MAERYRPATPIRWVFNFPPLPIAYEINLAFWARFERKKSDNYLFKLSIKYGNICFSFCFVFGRTRPPVQVDMSFLWKLCIAVWLPLSSVCYWRRLFKVYVHQQVSLSERLLTSTLEVESARMSDMGKYVCRASKNLATRINVDVLNGTLRKYHAHWVFFVWVCRCM